MSYGFTVDSSNCYTASGNSKSVSCGKKVN